jgi:hypothetical protein
MSYLEFLKNKRKTRETQIKKNNTNYLVLKALIHILMKYEPNIVKKIWDYVITEKYELDMNEHYIIISLIPAPGSQIVNGRSFFNNKYLQCIIPKVKKFTYNYVSEQIVPIYDDSIKRIEFEAFANCHSLFSVILPDSIKSIAEGVFTNCSNLRQVNIPILVSKLSRYLFSGCHSLKNFKIPSRIKSISAGVFNECVCLKEIKIPPRIKMIPEDFCNMCYNLSTVIIGGNVKIIGDRAFKDCKYLTKLIIREGIEVINSEAFHQCHSLISITLPKTTLKRIEYLAFGCCFSLNEIKLYEPLEHIGEKCFYRSKLKEISFPKTVTQIGGWAFSSNNYLRSVNLPDSLKVIQSKTFAYCKLTDIILPNSIEVLEYKAFGYNDLRVVLLPENLTCIQNEAFIDNSNLKDVIFSKKINELGPNVFAGCLKIKEIDLPVDFNKTHAEWSLDYRNKDVKINFVIPR